MMGQCGGPAGVSKSCQTRVNPNQAAALAVKYFTLLYLNDNAGWQLVGWPMAKKKFGGEVKSFP